MEIPVMFQAVLTRVESQELSKPLTGKVGVPGVGIEPTTRGFSVRTSEFHNLLKISKLLK